MQYIGINSGEYRSTRTAASVAVTQTRVFPTFVSHRVRIGGLASGKECDIDISEVQCLLMLEAMRAERVAREAEAMQSAA